MAAQSSLQHGSKVRRPWMLRCVGYLICRLPKATSPLGELACGSMPIFMGTTVLEITEIGDPQGHAEYTCWLVPYDARVGSEKNTMAYYRLIACETFPHYAVATMTGRCLQIDDLPLTCDIMPTPVGSSVYGQLDVFTWSACILSAMAITDHEPT
jgi:hypothetical protein